MNPPTCRVVFDCNTLLQAALSERGPAFGCLLLAEEQKVELLASPDTLAEARDVLNRPKIHVKNPQLTPERIRQFLALVTRHARCIDDIPHVISFPRDPKDEPYLDLAIGAGARYLVTRDKDLLDLMDQDKPEGREFCRQYPNLRILDPAAFLRELE